MNDQTYWVDPDGTAHERCQLLFVSTGELVAFDPGAHPTLRWPRSGWAYYCSQCIDIWERIIQLDSRGVQRHALLVSVACAKHHDQWNVAGSVLAGGLEGLLEVLPLAILQREFDLHIKDNNVQRFTSDRSDDSPGGGTSTSEQAGSDTPDTSSGRSEGAVGGAYRHG